MRQFIVDLPHTTRGSGDDAYPKARNRAQGHRGRACVERPHPPPPPGPDTHVSARLPPRSTHTL